MKLNKVLCLFLMLAVVLSVASCDFLPIGGIFGDSTKEHKVIFSVDGEELDALLVKDGEPVSAPKDPVKEGHTFTGWYNGEKKWNFSDPVKEDLLLTARWEKSECSHVDSDGNGKCDSCGADYSGTVDETYTITYMDGDKKLDLSPKSYTASSTGLKLPTPGAKKHYEFTGWYSDRDLTRKVTSINVNAGEDLTFYAGFAPKSYKITYDLDGGENAESNLASLTVLDLPLTLADPTRDGYTFKGWYTDANCTKGITEFDEDNIANLTVYAKWEKVIPSHTVTYLDHEGNEIASETFYESESDQPLKEGYELEGYIFLGWVSAQDPTVTYTVIPAGTTTDLVLKANMQKDIVPHNVNFYINGELYSTMVFGEAEGLSDIPSVNKAGHSFNGWYDNADCTGDAVTSIAPGTANDVDLYGTLTVITYSVKYYDGETELTLELTSYQVSESDIALPELPDKVGFKKMGWYNAEGTKYTVIAAGSTGDLVLYARYESAIYYITYHLGGGENDERNVTEYGYDELPTLYSPLSREGYLFLGWYTDPAFSGKAVSDLSDYANEDVTLYARWAETNDESGTNTPEHPW